MAGISSKSAGKLENKFKVTGKELQHFEFNDGSGLEEYDFGARFLDPQIGRWHTIDPIAEKHTDQSMFNYVLNNPLRFIDPDGMEEKDTDGPYGTSLQDLRNQGSAVTIFSANNDNQHDEGGAWKIKNKWDTKYINQFRSQLKAKLKSINNSDTKFTCDDLALSCIIDFASTNNLPFRWTTEFGIFDASDTKYNNKNDFQLEVMKHSGAPDFANDANTLQISFPNISAGSLNVLTADGKKLPNHIQIIASVLNNKSGVSGFIAGQGNFRTPTWVWNRATGSNDPTSFRYLGTHIQSGIFDATSNTWESPQTGKTCNFIGGHYSSQFREFNFMSFNR